METPNTILLWLQKQFPSAKSTTLREMIEKKRVLLNGEAAKSLKQAITAQDVVALRDAGTPAGSAPRTLAQGLSLVYEDADVLVVEKPPGLLTSTHSQEPRPTALAVLNEYVQQRNQKAQVHLIHRLDKDASGLLIFARNHSVFENLKKQFAEHSVQRRYVAVVHGVFRKPAGRLEHRLYEDDRGMVHVEKAARDPRKKLSAAAKGRQSRQAILNFEVLSATVRLTLVRVTLHTGRKHQIRVQLKSIGHPVCGDTFYGTEAARQNDPPEAPGRLALHAVHLGFTHPRTRKAMTFDSPIPPGFTKLVPL